MKNLIGLCAVLFLTVTLSVQVGCKDVKDEPLPDVTASAITINGTVKLKETDANGTQLIKWHYGPAMIRAGKLANAALTSDGNFTLILPATIKGSDFITMDGFSAIQGGTCVAAPSTTNFAGSVEFIVDYTDNGVAKNMPVGQYLYVLSNNMPVISRSYTYNFYDRDGTFKGNSDFAKTYDWTFSKGWGMIESYYSSAASAYSSKSVILVPSEAVWTN